MEKITEFCETECSILTLYQKRVSLVQELVLFSLNMDLEKFQNYGVRLMHSIRQISLRLLLKLKSRNDFLANSNATFCTEDECILCLIH